LPEATACSPSVVADTIMRTIELGVTITDAAVDEKHTYASLARACGADLRYVQKTMGHSTPTVTANIYSDLYADELDHVATNLDRLHGTAKNQATGQGPDTPNHP